MLCLEDIRSSVAEVAPAYDVDKVYLFGSYARGEAHEKSDVDLCLETGATFSLCSAGDFSRKLESAWGTSVDMVTERSLYDFARKSCLRDRVLLYERV
ncbi:MULTISPECIES: nucleotidyltransferase family protein [unclassified Adlercreutzia]|uniref:nucleotidyltransferase family protein n=1 Tax=unclassified Adlercreutzia TaxID=2636013 RepID=UPI0013EB285C|nr:MULTISPECIES: nucleotidyltransferase domain-containing protein [unclassified Adlercreutzia]